MRGVCVGSHSGAHVLSRSVALCQPQLFDIGKSRRARLRHAISAWPTEMFVCVSLSVYSTRCIERFKLVETGSTFDEQCTQANLQGFDCSVTHNKHVTRKQCLFSIFAFRRHFHALFMSTIIWSHEVNYLLISAISSYVQHSSQCIQANPFALPYAIIWRRDVAFLSLADKLEDG